MNEFKLIEYLTRNIKKSDNNIIESIGDDTAVIEFNKREYLLFTIDSLIENIHFSLKWNLTKCQLFYYLGWKSVAINVSDILAMGGKPFAFVVSLSIPEYISQRYLKCVYNGINDCSKFYNIVCVGGNITANKTDFMIDIAMLGKVLKNRLLLRKNAKTGDFIYVQKYLGESSAGLKLLMKGKIGKEFIQAHLMPRPQIEWDIILKKYKINSAIDISDGFIGDLSHILEASGKGAEIFVENLPVSEKLKNKYPENWQDMVLYGGEEYKIIFTSPDDIEIASVSKVGKVISRKGIFIIKDNKKYRIKNISGFIHFK